VLMWARTRTRFTAGIRVPAGRSACTPLTPHCRFVPGFQCAWAYYSWKLAAEQSGSKSHELFSVKSIVADGVFQTLISWSKFWSTPGLSEASSSCTLNRAIDQLPKRLRMFIKAKGGHVEYRMD